MNTIATQFERFWTLYPRKVGKIAARKAFDSARKRCSIERLIERAGTYRQCVDHWAPDSRQFIPHPSTWLNQGRWDDDDAEWRRLMVDKPKHKKDADAAWRRTQERLAQQRAEDERIKRERERR